MSWQRSLSAVLVAGAVAAPATAAPREELERLRQQLEAALQQGASPIALLGESRTYYVRGEGALVALAPRALSRHREALVLHGLPGLPLPGDRSGAAEAVPPEIAAQMAAMEREAERARREAQRAFEQVRRQIRLRVGDRTAPLPAPDVDPALPPPWRFWFEIGEPGPPDEPMDPGPLLSEAREKVTGALVAHPPALEGLAPGEFLAVAVDFVSGGLLVPAPSPQRTLMVRVRKSDLDALRSGRIDAAEFRTRVAYDEY
jgi:hypothetical protein